VGEANRARRWAALAAAVPIAAGLAVATGGGASAAAGCSVDYRITNQWQGGFGASVTVRNLGDPVSGWRLTWTFPAGERVTQGWNAEFSSSGGAVTAANVGWNAGIDTGGSVSFGFTGSASGTPGTPASFALNGTTCTGSTQPTTTRPTTTTTTTTPPPSSGWNPPSSLVQPLGEVWRHQEATYNNGNLYGFGNYGWDQVMANGGYVNYCVRWDSSAPVSADLRDRVHAALQRQVKKWMDTMVGHNGWPYADVPVRVVGWAVRDRAQLQWSDSSVDIYVNDIRENAPQCAEGCGRFFNQSGQYPRCPGGLARHYDQSLWLTAGMGGGAGGDWGQRIGSEYYVNALNQENIHILLHELGHTYGLDDFYDWTPTGVGGFLMKAGSASSITEFDKWMFRDWWRHLKSRYGY
jgi:hypothetical protein